MRKRLNIYSVSIALGILLTLCGCNKFLDVQSNSGLEVPNSLESFQKLLDASSFVNMHLCSYGEVSADDYFLTESSVNRLSDVHRPAYYWEKYAYFYSNDWSKAYTPVYTANLVLDKLAEIERTAENAADWDRVKGSALFYRSTQFLSLVWTFAHAYDIASSSEDLGIALRKTSNPNIPSERASVAECYAEILNGFKEAARLLPEEATHVMRPSKIASLASLARVYLSMNEFDSAYVYADKALQLNNYLLDFNDPENVSLNLDFPFQRFNRETLSYFELIPSNPQVNFTFSLIDTVLCASYDENDLRGKAYFIENSDGYSSFGGSYTGDRNLFGGLAVNELFLIRAECLARLGRPDEALSDLNDLLAKRYVTGSFVPYENINGRSLLDLILTERRKELVFRGLRWIDIKRLNKEGHNIVLKRRVGEKEYILEPGDNRYALPLPEDIIRQTGMPQNPI
ncbi:RagB/SusD family nutrient uptake outer membrane protein [Sphingobacterium sp. DN00404]|uniref:RagB/SusD family nutrient uptake outer membrane protein n=1 Tax=Sphingobacterium micropteri TaxID=2763501 RepID=A0ABR7YR05_9SPHI|nr:RagB/SusD family nutrient uptake outer membrane protein [Sphingobacterium micropteri]MBD1433762.1 RagB/SusD family nutrient uptake outer membrane protein [Sphingobacterium micropteri]